jgi:molecular chaperone GrpE
LADEKKDKNGQVSSSIPQSVFEEALKAVETIEQERQRSKTDVNASSADVDLESTADDLESLLALLDKKTGPAPAAKAGKSARKGPELSKFVKNGKPKAKSPKTASQAAAPNNAPVAEPDPAKDEKIAELTEKITRMSAEFDNYKKRMTREAEESKKYYNEQIILQLLPIVDNFERAIQHMDNEGDRESMQEGIGLIYRQIVGLLEDSGLEAIETDQQKFDPAYHEAVGTIPDSDAAPGSILTDYETGYLLNGRLLRPSKVMVAVSGANGTTANGESEKQTESNNS